MHHRGVLGLLLAVVVLTSPATVGGVGPGAGGPAVDEAGAVPGAAAGPPTGARDRHDLTLRIDVQEDGDARWTVTTYVPLEDENDTEAFRSTLRDWEAGTLDAGLDAELFRNYARLASNATGREMRIPADSVNRTGGVVANGSRGALRLTFTWTNFARRVDDRLVIDDTFRTESGTWLDGLAAGQRLVIRAPPGFTPESFPAGARLENGSRVIWEGETTFPPTYFTDDPVVFTSSDAGPGVTPTPTLTATPTVTPTPTATTTGTAPPDGDERSLGLWLGVGAAALLGGGLALYRLVGDGDAAGDAGTDTSDGPDPGAAASGTVAAEDATEDDGTGDDGPGDETAPEPTPADPFAGVDEELLSDEERVVRLLEANGGRMKQATIVKETGWSNAKVSQLLSSMNEDGEIDKLRIGRENLISLPDVDVGEVE